jgi:hypothetical protein
MKNLAGRIGLRSEGLEVMIGLFLCQMVPTVSESL